MRVFVTGTGRCGSVCFSKACGHITNFSSAHESESFDLIYSDSHIEVNPQLWIVIPLVVKKYPNAKWVHLVRDPDTCIPSIAALGHGSVSRAFSHLFITIASESEADSAKRLYEASTQNIRSNFSSLISPENQMEIRLENAKDKWSEFWSFIGAEGDFDESQRCWDTPVNTRAERGEDV